MRPRWWFRALLCAGSLSSSDAIAEPPASGAVARFPLEEEAADAPLTIVVEGPVGAFPDVEPPDRAELLLEENPYRVQLQRRLAELDRLSHDLPLASPYLEELRALTHRDIDLSSPYGAPTPGISPEK